MSDAPSEPEVRSGNDPSSSSAPGRLEPSADGVDERPLYTARGALWAMLAADASGTGASGSSSSGRDDGAGT